jgi:small-conductance mechanosensitive channel
MLCGILAAPVAGAEPTADAAPKAAPVVQELSLASVASDLLELRAHRRQLLQQLTDASAPERWRARLGEIESTALPAVRTEAAGLSGEARLVDLLDVDTSAHALVLELAAVSDEISDEVRRVEKTLGELAERRSSWDLLESAADEAQAPGRVRERIEAARRTISALEESARGRRDRVLELLDRSTGLREELNDLRADLADRISAFEKQALVAASRPLWRVGLEDPRSSVFGFLQAAFSDLERVVAYARTSGPRVLLVFLVVLAAGLAISRTVRHRIEDDGPSSAPGDLPPVLAHAVSASVLMALVAAKLLAPPGPQAVGSLFWALMALPAAHLAASILGRGSGLPVALITFTVLLWPLRTYVEVVPLLDRLLLLVEDLAALAAVVLVLRRGVFLDRLSSSWRRAIRVLLVAEMALLVVSLVAGVVGEIGVARLLRDGAVVSLGLAMVIVGSARALLRVLSDLVRGPLGAQVRMIRDDPEAAFGAVRRAVVLVSVAAWAWFTLGAFQARRPLETVLRKVIDAGIDVGWFELTVGEVLAFLVVVVASFLVARVVCFVLDEEFLPRLPLARGVPYMISTSVRYLILLAGFTLALAALGVDLTKATLLAGAFGVGLGFGLQNVVNNFVSGLILLFERPIRVGDVIEVAGTLGPVSRIGIRSSTVTAFNGADIIVPNGDLISKEVTNWTLSSNRRLVEVFVGAAYGSEARQVIEILQRVAGEHGEVVADPAPKAFLVGFGDSQLDFRLVCWVAQYGDGYRVASELRVAVAEAFDEAGVEIPFPQQELRVKGAGGPLPDQVAVVTPRSQGQKEDE